MTGVHIRLSPEADLAALTEIYNEQVENGVATFDTEVKTLEERREWFLSHQEGKYPLISAVTNDQVLGWGSLSPFHPRPAYHPTTEFSVYVHKSYRGKGVGDMLLADLLDRARRFGFHSVIGCITSTNTASLKLVAKHGFGQVGYFREVGMKFNTWLDVVIVQLLLGK